MTASASPLAERLHALIEQARRRHRGRQLKILALIGTLAVLGLSLSLVLNSANTGPAKPLAAPFSARARTHLTILAINPILGRATFHISCTPAGGDLPHLEKACAALEESPALVTHPAPWICGGNERSWWDVSISGRLGGHALRRSFSTCWTPQMPTIGRLGIGWTVLEQHIGPQRQQAVPAGRSVTFPSGVLRAGDLVTCNLGGNHWEMGVPNAVIPLSEHYSTGPLNVHPRPDGSVVASCRAKRS